MSDYNCDILIAGSGFAGSLTALALNQSGFNVCLIEKAQHPRFAIGESSTPIADMILRNLANTYNLPWLYNFSRYGSWQQHHPEIVCGLKRGFSYYKHQPAKPFESDKKHSHELLVAASSSDTQSDTQWFRADFDAFLVDQVKGTDINYLDHTLIESATRESMWQFKAKRKGVNVKIKASLFIDATGSSGLLESLFNIQSTAEGFLTNSSSIFSHFEHVPRWTNELKQAGIPIIDYPYDPDHSALHQLLQEGWLWMLRFNNEKTSVGLMLDGNKIKGTNQPTEEIWKTTLSQYPLLQKLMKTASLSTNPGKLISTKRLQRKIAQGFGNGWVALPHTIGFVDPLHSTGIAHTLSGVEKLLKIVTDNWGNNTLYDQFKGYEQSVFQELSFIDQLVAGCYKTLPHFGLFITWTMLYFTAAINYEQKRLNGKPPTHFLDADNPEMTSLVQVSYDDLLATLEKPDKEAVRQFTERIRQSIKPYNITGLLEPSAKNMYYHTAAAL